MTKVKSAARTLKLLEIIADSKDGLTFTEIQDHLETPKSSTFNLIQELVNHHYLKHLEDSRRYIAGNGFVRMAASFIENADFIHILRSSIAELSDEIGYTTHAAILDDTRVIYLAKSDVDHDISLMKNIGLKLPAHCTAVGKVLLSQFSDSEIANLYDNKTMLQLTPNSIKSVSELTDQLHSIRKDGFATEVKESSEFACCIALPLYQNNQMEAAFSCTMPFLDFIDIDVALLLEKMKKHQSLIQGSLNSFLDYSR